MTKRFGVHFTYILALHLGMIFGLGILKLQEQHTSQQMPGVMKVSVATKTTTATVRAERIATKKYTPKPSLNSQKTPQPETKPQEVAETQAAPSGPAVWGSANSGGRAATVKEIYISEVRSRIEANKSYPLISRRMGQTGTAVVAFTLLKDGSIIDLHVHKSSKFDRLDASALDAVKKVGRFNPIPQEVGVSQMDITVPVKFYL